MAVTPASLSEDFGEIGLRDSLEAARNAKFPVVGIGLDEAAAFRPSRTTVKGQRIVVIGATQVPRSNPMDAGITEAGKPKVASAKNDARLLVEVRHARATADTVVVYLHWGSERVSCPTRVQQALARRLVDAGADVVVGSHAHVLLGGGFLGRAYVHFGLGNFVSHSSWSGPGTRTGVLSLTVRGRAVTDARWNPAHIEGGVPLLLHGSSATAARVQWDALRQWTGLAGHRGVDAALGRTD